MKGTRYRTIELFLLFILFPASLPLEYPIWLKLTIGILGFGYILWVLWRVEKTPLRWEVRVSWKPFWKRVAFIFPIIVLLTVGYVWWFAPQHLFFVPFHKPRMFLFILLVYSMFSVLPQGILYRTFFFRRYGNLFQSKTLLIFVNAILFSLAHLFFRNALVMVITFFGRLLFALSYLRLKSGMLVNFEHLLYGNWLFTVGMGQMLGFPGMEN